jgi:cardiolipin synthase
VTDRRRPPIVGQLPNLLSVARLGFAPLAVTLIVDGRFGMAFWLFVAAAVTDAADGLLARWLDARTALGSFLDPAADKLLLVGTYVALAWRGAIPEWLVILVVFRDVGIVLGLLVLWMAGRPFRSISPTRISKLNTVLQIALVVGTLAVLGLSIDAGWLIEGVVWAVTATTVASGVGYLRAAMRRFAAAGAHA